MEKAGVSKLFRNTENTAAGPCLQPDIAPAALHGNYSRIGRFGMMQVNRDRHHKVPAGTPFY